MSFVRFFKILFLAILVSNVFAQSSLKLELVESVPVETKLGLASTSRTLPVWLNMIQFAENSINMEFFYISDKEGEPLEQVLSALKSSANQGVQIRIITDARMANTYPETLENLNRLPNIEVRRISWFNQDNGVLHAKYFIVDDKEVFIGSQNMDWRALKHIHELGARIQSPELAQLFMKIFEWDWQMAGTDEQENVTAEKPSLPGDLIINAQKPVELTDIEGKTVTLFPIFSPKDKIYEEMEWDEQVLVDLIDQAKERVEIQLLSYKPGSKGYFYAKLDNALRRAAARDVDVRMIVSNWNTRYPGVQHLKSLQVIPNVEIKISSIPQLPGKFIPYARVEHCKYMVVDEKEVWLGTSNWSYSYFHRSRNLGIVIQSEGINTTIHQIFEKSWDSEYCSILDPCKSYQPPKISNGN